MKVSRNTKYGLCVLATLLFVVPSLVGRAQQTPAAPAGGAAASGTTAGQAAGRGQAPARVPLLSKDKLRFQPEEAETGGAVFGGRESEPGVYITRNLFRAKTATTPAGGSRPHYHDQDRWVTVLKGTWYTGTGDFYDADKMVAIKAGGMMYHPAGLHHYDGARDEDVIVQIMGIGPVTTIQTEVDANGVRVVRGGGAGAGAGRGAAPAAPATTTTPQR